MNDFTSEAVKLKIAQRQTAGAVGMIMIIAIAFVLSVGIFAAFTADAGPANCTCRALDRQTEVLKKIERHLSRIANRR